MSGTCRLPKNAKESCTKDKNSKNFCASENGTSTASDCSTTRVPKGSRGFLELSVRNGRKYYKRAAQLLIAPLWVALSLKASVKLFVTPRNFYLSNFKGMDCWIKKEQNDVNILMPTTFFHSRPGYLIFCTTAVPKLDSVVGEEAHLKVLLANHSNRAARCCLINCTIGPSTLKTKNKINCIVLSRKKVKRNGQQWGSKLVPSPLQRTIHYHCTIENPLDSVNPNPPL